MMIYYDAVPWGELFYDNYSVSNSQLICVGRFKSKHKKRKYKKQHRIKYYFLCSLKKNQKYIYVVKNHILTNDNYFEQK